VTAWGGPRTMNLSRVPGDIRGPLESGENPRLAIAQRAGAKGKEALEESDPSRGALGGWVEATNRAIRRNAATGS